MNGEYSSSVSVPLLQRDHGRDKSGSLQDDAQPDNLKHSPKYSLMSSSCDGPQADSNHRSGFEERVPIVPDAGNAERGRCPRTNASPEITTISQEKRGIPNEEKPSARELEWGLEDKTKSDIRNNRKLNLWLLNDKKRNKISAEPNRFTVKGQDCVYLQGLNPPQIYEPWRTARMCDEEEELYGSEAKSSTKFVFGYHSLLL